jgi:hypothetical protein
MKNNTLKMMETIPIINPAMDNFLLSSLLIPATPLTMDSIPNTKPNIGMKPTSPNANEYAPFVLSKSMTVISILNMIIRILI